MFKRLQNKLLLMNMIITSLVILGAFSVVYLTTYNNIRLDNESKLSEMSGASITFHSESGSEEPFDTDADVPQMNTVQSAIPSDYKPSFVLLFDKNGGLSGIETFLDMPQEVYEEAAELVEQDGTNVRVDFYDRQWLYSVFPYSVNVIGNDGRTVEVSDGSYRVAFLDITDTQNTLRQLLITFLFVGLAVLIVIFFVSLYFAKRSIKPISEAWERQQQFIADASHELKTPLSVITANYDALLANENETVKSQRQWLDYMKIGTDRMAKLINSLLSLVKIENNQIGTTKAPFDMSSTITQTIQVMDALLREKNISLTQSIEPNIIVNSNKDMIEQVFTILYENAIKYTDNAGKIDVSLSQQGQKAICTVRNTGTGIPKQDISKVFDRFYRADASRTDENGGYGLGLSVARAAIERLNGSISAQSIPNELTSFTFIVGGAK